MVAKVNGAIAAGSFVGHDIQHWTVTGVNLQTAAVATALFDTVEQKATIIEIGVLKIAAQATAFSTESPSAWTKATLEAAWDGNAATAAAVVTAVTY